MSHKTLGIEKAIIGMACFFLVLLVARNLVLADGPDSLDPGVVKPLTQDRSEGVEPLRVGDSPVASRDSILPDDTGYVASQEHAIVSVRAVDTLGNRLMGVEVWKLDHYDGELQGVTDREGQLQVSLALSDTVRLQGLSDLGISPPTDIEVTENSAVVLLEIETLEAIHGVVTQPNGDPVGAGILVLAARSDQALTREIAQSSYFAHTLQRVVETNQYGEFSFEKLPHGQAFHLTAGGDGLVNFPASMSILAGTEDVELSTEYAYAVVVTVCDASGSPPVVSEDLRYGVGGELSMPSGVKARRLPGYVVGAYLAGLRVSERVQESNTSQLMLFTSIDRLDALGLFQISYSLPGYARFRGEFEAPFMADELVEVTFDVGEAEVEFGEIKVQLVGLGEGLDRDDCHTVGGYLQLFQQGRPLLSFAIPDLSAESLYFRDIPFGTYDLAVVLAQGLVRFPADSSEPNYVSVSSEPATVAVEASDLGGVTISAIDLQGVSYSGPLRLSIARVEDVTMVDGEVRMKGMVPVILPGPPFRIAGLPSGELIFQPHFPFSYSGPIPSIDVQPGSLQELVIQSGS